jgi:hypothetical protein
MKTIFGMGILLAERLPFFRSAKIKAMPATRANPPTIGGNGLAVMIPPVALR